MRCAYLSLSTTIRAVGYNRNTIIANIVEKRCVADGLVVQEATLSRHAALSAHALMWSPLEARSEASLAGDSDREIIMEHHLTGHERGTIIRIRLVGNTCIFICTDRNNPPPTHYAQLPTTTVLFALVVDTTSQQPHDKHMWYTNVRHHSKPSQKQPYK